MLAASMSLAEKCIKRREAESFMSLTEDPKTSKKFETSSHIDHRLFTSINWWMLGGNYERVEKKNSSKKNLLMKRNRIFAYFCFVSKSFFSICTDQWSHKVLSHETGIRRQPISIFTLPRYKFGQKMLFKLKLLVANVLRIFSWANKA